MFLRKLVLLFMIIKRVQLLLCRVVPVLRTYILRNANFSSSQLAAYL